MLQKEDTTLLQKDDFIQRLAEKGYTKKDAKIIINDFIRTLEEELVKGNSVMFRGFGTFEVRERNARQSVLPDSTPITIPAHRSVHFSVGKLLKREVKQGFIRD